MKAEEIFDRYKSLLVSETLSSIWRGYGSTIILEFGPLEPRLKRDGAPGQAQGTISAMINWSWRIESSDTILCGSWSDEQEWGHVFDQLIGSRVTEVGLLGKLPEITIELSGGLRVLSFMTSAGQPNWTLINRMTENIRLPSLHVENGRLAIESVPFKYIADL